MKLFGEFRKVGISSQFNVVKSSLINYGRNLATCGFLDSKCDHMLFVDSDVEFEPEAVLRMLIVQKDIVCTPYRVKLQDTSMVRYAVDYPDKDKIEISFDLDKKQNAELLDLLKQKVGKKRSSKRKKLNISVFKEKKSQ